MNSFINSLRLGLSTVFALAAFSAFGQDTPVGVPVRINASADVYVNGSGDPATLVLNMAVTPTTDHPLGSFDLVDQKDSNAAGTLAAHPPGDTGISPRYVGHLEPGKIYSLGISGTWTRDVALTITPPANYLMEIAGAIRTSYTIRSEGFANAFVPLRVLNPLAQFAGRAGVASSIESGRIHWQVALGGAKGGGSAGALAVIDAGTASDWTSIFTPAGLQYESASPEIHVERANGDIRQVLANEACVDVFTLTATSYELRFYHFEQMRGSTGVRTFVGFPFVTYRIEQDGAGTTKLKITSETRQLNGTFSPDAPASSTVIGTADVNAPIARTSVTTLERTGSWPAFIWDLKDWNTVGQTQLVQELRTWGGTTSARTESVNVGSGVTRTAKTFSTFNWGEEVAASTVGASPTPTVDSTLDYYTATSPVGSYGALRSRSSTGEGWEAYEYDPANFGVVTRMHRPYQGSPSAVPADLAANTLGEITSYSYALDAFGRLTRPTLIETRVNGTLTAKATITYSTANVTGRDTLKVVTATRTDYSAASGGLVTETKYFQEDAGLYFDGSTGNPIRPYEAFFRSQPVSVTTADGVKRSFVHQLGSWNGSTFTASANNGLDDGTASRSIEITGSATTGTNYPAHEGYDIEDLCLVTDTSEAGITKCKSTMTATIRDQYARVVRVENYVRNNTAWVLISGINFDHYDWSNQLTHSQLTYSATDTGAEYDAQFNGELKQWEKDPAGIKVSYAYDAAGRVETATKDLATGIGALTTKSVYDAESRLTQTIVGWAATGNPETITSSRSYDNAGRLSSESAPGPNGAMPTSYVYAPATRQVTITFPNGGTRIEQYQNDGSLQQVTGTAVIPEYYTYEVQAGGIRYARINLGTNGSSRLREGWKDWLGRATKSSRPGFSTNSALVEEPFYETGTGRLQKLTRTVNSVPVYAPVLYRYDAMSQLSRSGMDLDNSGELVQNSTDRISDSDQYFVLDAGAWWQVKVSKTYPKASDATALTVSTARRRLTVFTATLSGFSGVLQAEVQNTDVDGNITTVQTFVDRNGKTTKVATSTTGLTGQEIQTYVNGLPTSLKRFDGVTYNTGYDALHRRSTSVDPRTNVTTTTYYRDRSSFVYRIWGVINPTGNFGDLSTFTYDNAGRVIVATDTALGTKRMAYNTRDQLLQQWGSAAHPVSYAYNGFGERVAMRTFRLPTEDFTQAAWPLSDHGGDPNNPNPAQWTAGDKTTWSYDGPSGLLASKTDAKNNSVSFTYNDRGQTATRRWARGLSTVYGYDGSTGELTSQTYYAQYFGPGNPSNVADGTPAVAYTYTRAGQLWTAADAVTGSRTFNYGTASESHALRLDWVSLPSYFNNRQLTRRYDTLNHRPAGFTLGTSGSPAADLTQAYTYNGLGQFDHLDAASSAQASRTFTYGYNTGGLVASLTVTSPSFVVNYGYENYRNLLRSVDSLWGAVSRTRYDYVNNALGQRYTAKQSGNVFDDFGGSIYRRHGYNARGEVESSADYLGETPIALGSEPDAAALLTQLPSRNFAYTYDKIGNRRTSSRSGTALDGDGNPQVGAESYTLDAAHGPLNEYSSRTNGWAHAAGTVSASTTSVSASGSLPWGVGTKGRFWAADTQVSGSTPSSVTLTLAAAIAGGGSGGANLVRTESRTAILAAALQSFSYDNDGNLTGDGLWTYTYDAENRLTAMETEANARDYYLGVANARRLEFQYDYLNRRVQKLVRTGWTGSYYATVLTQRRYLYDGDNLVAELTGDGTGVVRSYAWGLDLSGTLTATGGVGALVQITDHTNNASYLPTYDGNGNVVSLLRVSDGAAVGKYEYSPFGELLRAEGTVAKENPFRFSTKFTDDESGLVYYGARFYSPSLGRFINRDPIEEAGGLNLYGFCGNDAINHWDHLGNSWLSKQIGSIGRWINKNKQVIIAVVAVAASIITYGAVSGWATTWLAGSATSVGAAWSATAVSTLAGAMGGAAAGFVGGAMSTALNGGSLGQTVSSGLRGAAAGAVMGGIAGYYGNAWNQPMQRIGVSAAGGGVASEISGGSFRDGAVIGGTQALLSWGWSKMEKFTDEMGAKVAAQEPDRLTYDSAGSLRTDGATLSEDGGSLFGQKADRLFSGVDKFLEGSGMANQGNGQHWYDAQWLGGPTKSPISRFINLVSKAHDFWNGWDYNQATGAFISRGATFNAAFNIWSFSGMQPMAIYTAASLSPAAPYLYQSLEKRRGP